MTAKELVRAILNLSQHDINKDVMFVDDYGSAYEVNFISEVDCLHNTIVLSDARDYGK